MVAKKTGSSGEALPVRVSWQVRCPKICTQLDFITRGHDSPFLCLQEVLYPQLLDIQAGLGEGWGYVGIGRDDGDRLGELSPVFYRVDTWKCEVFKNYWLSETPDRPSKGWDAALPRIVTVGEFVHKRTGQRAVVMSTHFDHLGVVAREQSAKLILRIAAHMVAKGSGMADAHALVPAEKRYGNELTYTSFDEPDQQAVRIDFIFVKVPSDVKVRAAKGSSASS
ncbi:endonuclease/exonuclease/phosphatase family protein [Verticillium dahliae]|nr:endonuclease/exonuclease/phosphatase family protein [Verticillium dahliae]